MPAVAPSPTRPASTEVATPPVQTAGEHHRWTVAEYHQLGRAGGFQYGDLGPHETRVELLEGVIASKYAEGSTDDEIRLRWTRDMYERLVENGGFEGLRVELIHGQILDKVSPQGSPHSTAITLVQEALRDAFGRGVCVRVQLPLRALNESEPEPDVAIVAGSPRDYVSEHPSAALLVVEVADSSLAYDRTTKLAVYAESGFPDYWIANVHEGCVEVHRDPADGTYLSRRTYDEGDVITPLTRSDVTVPVADLLP